MILINYHDSDPTVFPIIDWLNHLGFKYHLIHQNSSVFEFKNVSINNNGICFNLSKEIEGKQITYWNRRSLPLHYKFDISSFGKTNLKDFFTYEFKFINEALNLHFEDDYCLNKYRDNDTNKINNLFVAQSFKLKIPDTFITNKKKYLEVFANKYTQIITKAIDSTNYLFDVDQTGLSTLIDKEVLNKLPEVFFPSVFQEYIEKKIELRSFFIGNKFFTIAIFSQNDSSTSIDLRNYNYSKPNRTVPFQLPKAVEIKLKRTMKKLNLNTGCIDLILNKNNEFVFLEVNPVGMLGQLSWPLNINVEKEIALYLANPIEYAREEKN